MFAGCCPLEKLFNEREDKKIRIILGRLDWVENALRDLSVAGSNRSKRVESLMAISGTRSGTSILMGNNEDLEPFSQLCYNPFCNKNTKCNSYCKTGLSVLLKCEHSGAKRFAIKTQNAIMNQNLKITTDYDEI